MQEIGKTRYKPVDTPIDPNHKLGEASEDATVDKGMCQRLVGNLIYLSHTRPNTTYTINLVSQFMHNPKEVHLQVVYRFLHYWKATLRKGILFKNSIELSLEAYIDANYARSVVDLRSTMGYCTSLQGNLVT